MNEKDLELELDRLEAINECHNLWSLFNYYHSASDQEGCLRLWARKAIGRRFSLDTWGVWKDEGLDRFFKETMRVLEADITNKAFSHENMTPIIEVAADCQTARGLFNTIGLETLANEDGTPAPCWCVGNYNVAYIKEEGQWKLWMVDWQTNILTEYAGKGWTEMPIHPLIANRIGEEGGIPLDMQRLGPDISGYHVHRPYSNKSTGFNLHEMFPPPPRPYETWDDSLMLEY